MRKIKYKTKKFFGYPEDNWARLRGRHGKKRSYGHFAGGGNPGGRTVAEIRNSDDRQINNDSEMLHG